MLIFIDESGDLSFKFRRGAIRYFTVVLVVFDDEEAAEVAIPILEQVRSERGLPESREFHFYSDSDSLRRALLTAASRLRFRIYSFTIDKERIWDSSLQKPKQAYQRVCQWVFENLRDDVTSGGIANATVVFDKSGDRQFRRALDARLRQAMNGGEIIGIKRVTAVRSESDVRVQLADYVAGVTNRLHLGKKWANEYDAFIRAKRKST
ncbi:MAG: DUF3800 domain-containing protein, partial [Dehalococcoidia bacterium]